MDAQLGMSAQHLVAPLPYEGPEFVFNLVRWWHTTINRFATRTDLLEVTGTTR